MATISSVVVRSDGWSCDVTIAGWAGEQGNISYDFDANGTPKFVLTVTSEGYNSSGVLGTVTREVYGTTAVRLPYPNEASLDETDSGSDIVIRVALSDHVYDDDKDGGAGTSGTDPSVSIAAECFSITGDPTAAYSGTVTNNSTLDYPKVIGQWDLETTPFLSRVDSAFDIGFIAYHGFQVACVQLSAVGATSSHSESGFVTSPTVTSHSASGLKSESYKLSVSSLASYTQGENIALRAIAYPKVGDADSIKDTDDSSAGYAAYYENDNSWTVTCDKTGALIQYAVVDTAGNNATGVTSATLAIAEALPYLTIAGAIDGGATVIYLNDGAFNPFGGTTATRNTDFFVEIRPHPSSTTASITRGGTRTYGCDKVAWIGLPWSGTDFLDGNSGDKILKVQDCTYDYTGSVTVGIGYRNQGVWFIDVEFTGGTDNSEFAQFSSVDIMYNFSGCNFNGGNFVTNRFSQIAGCLIDGRETAGSVVIDFSATLALNVPQNKIVTNNKIVRCVENTQRRLAGDLIDDCVIVGNLIESSDFSASGPNIWLSADGSTSVVNNLVFAHNTNMGSRINFMYNDTGTVAILKTNVFFIANATCEFNIKSDDFAASPNGNRVGNWSVQYGAGFLDSISAGSSSSPAFEAEYFGLNGNQAGLDPSARSAYLDFVDDASNRGTGLGNGDYTPAEGSVLRNQTLIRPLASFDFNGTAIGSEIGAISIANAFITYTVTGTDTFGRETTTSFDMQIT